MDESGPAGPLNLDDLPIGQHDRGWPRAYLHPLGYREADAWGERISTGRQSSSSRHVLAATKSPVSKPSVKRL
jgi:hypothetical protein